MGPAASCIRAPAPTEGPRSKSSGPSSGLKAAEKKLQEVNQVVGKAVPLALNAMNEVATKALVHAGMMTAPDKLKLGSAVSTPFGIGVLDRFRDDGVAVVRLDFGAKAFLDPSLVRGAPVPGKGEKCSTVYGDGVVEEIRDLDKFVVVKLNFGAKAFLRRDQVRPQRAYPFVPASHWTSGIYKTVVAPAAVSMPATKGSQSPAKGSQSPAKSPAKASPVTEVPASHVKAAAAAAVVVEAVVLEAPASPAKPAAAPVAVETAEAPAAPTAATPAHPAEEKDASEVPAPAEAEPPAAAEGAEETEAAAPATGAISGKKKKNKKKH